MRYAQFYVESVTGSFIEALGTDGVFQMSGRWGANRMHDEARAYAKRLEKVRKFVAFDIRQATKESGFSGRAETVIHRPCRLK